MSYWQVSAISGRMCNASVSAIKSTVTARVVIVAKQAKERAYYTTLDMTYKELLSARYPDMTDDQRVAFSSDNNCSSNQNTNNPTVWQN